MSKPSPTVLNFHFQDTAALFITLSGNGMEVGLVEERVLQELLRNRLSGVPVHVRLTLGKTPDKDKLEIVPTKTSKEKKR